MVINVQSKLADNCPHEGDGGQIADSSRVGVSTGIFEGEDGSSASNYVLNIAIRELLIRLFSILSL